MNEWKHMKRLASVEFWDAAVARAMRSLLQGLAVGFTGGIFNIVDMDWKTLALSGVGMAVASLINSMIVALPEETQ